MPCLRPRNTAWRPLLLSTSDLKTWLFRDLSQRQKVLLILASFDVPCPVRRIKDRAIEIGFRVPKSWNVSDALSRSRGLAIRTAQGWEITDAGKQHLRDAGITEIHRVVQIAIDLRNELPHIKDAETRSFADEAVKCYEAGLYRSAIVMSWIGAVSVLHSYVHKRHLPAFNVEARRVDARWKDAVAKEDLGRMREADFLDRIAGMSLLGGGAKAELKGCLDRRNACGHPSSLQVSANTAAHHIEVLILNVYKRYQ